MPVTARPAPTAAPSILALAPQVILLAAPDGSARLIDLNGLFYAVSISGAEMLREAIAHGSAAAAETIARRYGVEPERIREDLQVFLGQLRSRGLLSPGGPMPPDPLVRRVTPKWVLRPAFWLVRVCCRSLRVRAWALLTLAWLSFRLAGWHRTLAAWQSGHRPSRAEPAAPAETARTIDEAVRTAAARHPLGMSCKERALCCWTLAR